eukprot:CAMPEP_0198682464 /NCGR_PEP_ID=MMETSP1468-20131203/8747_1 /TAXON_ID=1461545 /ORGANISM="Mantoniella sp, Strain CCMP1436" /LENGTH=65 /DNA_ID=CAMNT_0044425407 /DNA_START=46 /DNA_END=243 /DNA_ORIENTATION=+
MSPPIEFGPWNRPKFQKPLSPTPSPTCAGQVLVYTHPLRRLCGQGKRAHPGPRNLAHAAMEGGAP